MQHAGGREATRGHPGACGGRSGADLAGGGPSAWRRSHGEEDNARGAAFGTMARRAQWNVGPTIVNSPLYQIGQEVFQTELEVLFFHLVDMHTLSPKIEEDNELPKVLTAKQLLGNA
jgi:hypothetical protein